MPRNSGWFDDIVPAGGDARVLAELRGRVGKKGNMRRFSRRGARRLGPKRSRIWVADANASLPESPIQISLTAATIVCGLSPELARTTPGTADHLLELKYRCIGRQGMIPFWRSPAQDTVTLDTDTGQGTALTILFYVWRVEEITADALAPQGTGSADPIPAADLRQLLQTDRVLNWGIRHVPEQIPVQFATKQIVAGAIDPDPQAACFNHKLSFIPMFRMPKMGITLGRDKAIVLRVRPLTWSEVASDWANPVGRNMWAHPLMRMRYVR